MADSAQTPFERFRILLRQQEGADNELEHALITKGTEEIGRIAYNKASELADKGLVNRQELDAIQQTAPVITTTSPGKSLPEQSPKPFSFSDLWPGEKGGGGSFSEEEYPEMYHAVLGKQKEELLGEIKKIAGMTNKEEREERLERLLDRFETNALLDDYHAKLISALEQLPSFQRLTQGQQDYLREKLDTQHKQQKDTLEREAESSKTTKEARKETVKKQLQEVTSREFDKHSEENTDRILQSQQKPLKPTFQNKFNPRVQDAWREEDFESLFEELFRPQIVRQPAGVVVTTQPTVILHHPSQPEEAVLTPNPSATRTIGRAPSQQAKNFLKGLRKGSNLATKAIKTATKETVKKGLVWAFTSPPYVGEIVVGIILLCILIIVFFLLILSILGGSPSRTATLPSSCSPSADCLAKLKAYGIVLAGDLSLNGDPLGKAKPMYDTIALVTQAPSDFGHLLKLPDQQIDIIVHTGKSCAGHASTNGVLDYYGWCNTPIINQFMILHELGHMIAFRNPTLYWIQFLVPYLTLSFFDKNMPTFNCQLDYGPHGPYPAECFADMIGEYVFYPTYRHTASGLPSGPSNFSTFPQFAGGFYYNFSKKNIFNGLVFSQ